MPSALLNGAIAGIAAAAMVTISTVLSSQPLERKLAAGQRLLFVAGASCVLGAIGLLTTDPQPVPPFPAAAEAAELADRRLQFLLRDATRDLRSTVALLLFGAASLSVPLALLLSPLRRFVLEHRLDLATRMQIEARHSEPRQPSPAPGAEA